MSEQETKSLFQRLFGQTPLPYPGRYEDANREFKECSHGAEPWEGARIEVTKLIQQTPTKEFAMTHSLNMGSPEVPEGATYEFGSQLVLDSGKHVFQGRTDTSFSVVQGTYVHKPNDDVDVKTSFVFVVCVC
eukprot:TRINITY_DN1825_c0_g1_i2.p1 TRINITY_DN1825_c0_g1~~TRINITY_DN1825_c0_g1_i2.p1  ORF type:complete len:151 (+),score=54.39 TRINITY_DN1825_c0_g1_i2:60-455(+)